MSRAAWEFSQPSGGNNTIFNVGNVTSHAGEAAFVTGNLEFNSDPNVTLRAEGAPLPFGSPLPAAPTDESSALSNGYLLDINATFGFFRSAAKVSTARQRAAPRATGGPPRWDLTFTLDGGRSALNIVGVPLWLDSDAPPPAEVLSGRRDFDGGPWPLRHICVVVEHRPDQPRGERWELDSAYTSCFYPFTHHRYGPDPAFDEPLDVGPDVDEARSWIPLAVTVDVRLSDDPYLSFQRGTRGAGVFVGESRSHRLWSGVSSVVVGAVVVCPALWLALHALVELRTRALAHAHALSLWPKRLSRVGGSGGSLNTPPRAKRAGWRRLFA